MSKPRARFSAETNGRRNAVLWAIGAAPAYDMAGAPRGLTSTETLVLYTIERFVGFEQRNTGECWPALGSLADAAKVDVRTVRRCLRSLEEKGWLAVRPRKADGWQLTHVFRITPPEQTQPQDEPGDELH